MPVDFSRLSSRNTVGRMLRFVAYRLVPGQMRLPILQGPAHGYRWIAGAHVPACWLGCYEFEKQQRMAQHLRKGDTVFDIGAHRGYFTLVVSALVGQEGRVIAFEPLPLNLQYLQKHLSMNSITNATVIDRAVSDTEGTAHFEDVLAYKNRVGGRLAENGSIEVQTVKLDDLLAEGKVPVPDHIKIDVEGAESRVLKGAQNLLKEHPPTLFIDTHGRAQHKECCSFLQQLGYQVECTGEEIYTLSDGTERYYGDLLAMHARVS